MERNSWTKGKFILRKVRIFEKKSGRSGKNENLSTNQSYNDIKKISCKT